MKIKVTGYGCVCALGDNVKEISENLYKGEIRSSFPIDRLDSTYAHEYPVFQVSENILSQKKESESYSFLFLRKAVSEALEIAGLKEEDLKNAKVGVCIGTSVDASFNCFDFYKDWKKGEHSSLEPLNKYIKYSTAEEVLKHFQLSGISQTIVTACASGSDSIGIGAEWIENSLCDIVIAGGTDEMNMIPYTGFIKLMIASKDECRPFDKDRNGINLGEGAGIFIMESEYFAKRRNAKKCGLVLGYGNSCDGYHSTAPDPQGRGLKKAVSFAFKQAGIDKNQIAFINAHATGTLDNDAAESEVFKSLADSVPVMATKSMTGHTLGAAGAVEACISLICLNNKKVPAIKNLKNPDEKLNINPILKEMQIDGTKAALSTSLAFGGCNAALIIGGKDYE